MPALRMPRRLMDDYVARERELAAMGDEEARERLDKWLEGAGHG